MSYKGKIYVAYDANNDHKYFEELSTWVQTDESKFDLFNGYDILKKIDKVNDDILKEELRSRMAEADVCLLVVGDKTKSYRKVTRWQVETAINKNMPIIVINPNGIRTVDFDKVPTAIKKCLSLHIAYQPLILEFALKNWPLSHSGYLEKEKKHTIRYANSVYEALGLETYDI